VLNFTDKVKNWDLLKGVMYLAEAGWHHGKNTSSICSTALNSVHPEYSKIFLHDSLFEPYTCGHQGSTVPLFSESFRDYLNYECNRKDIVPTSDLCSQVWAHWCWSELVSLQSLKLHICRVHPQMCPSDMWHMVPKHCVVEQIYVNKGNFCFPAWFSYQQIKNTFGSHFCYQVMQRTNLKSQEDF
jgi:hypothetical protein